MGLIILRNPLIFPGGQARPGYNPGHLASTPRLRFSGVAQGGSFVNLLNPAKPTIVGTPTGGFSSFGPYTKYSGSTDATRFVGVVEHPTAVTHAAIVTPLSTGTVEGAVTMTGGFANADTGIVLDANRFGFWNGGSVGVAVTQNYAINVPYFVAFSVFNATNPNAYFFEVVVNLQTGQTYYGTGFGNNTLGTVSSAGYDIGGWSGGSNFQSNALVSAAMISVDTLILPQLLQWAKAPWDFWYPPTFGKLISLVGKSARAPIDLAGNLGGVSSYG